MMKLCPDKVQIKKTVLKQVSGLGILGNYRPFLTGSYPWYNNKLEQREEGNNFSYSVCDSDLGI